MDDAYIDLPTGDVQALLRLHQWGGHALVIDMTALFMTEAPRQMQVARRAIDAGQRAAAERAAHSLKASCAQLGAPRMRHICEQIEILAARDSLAPIGCLLDTLDTELASFAIWLDDRTKTLTGGEA